MGLSIEIPIIADAIPPSVETGRSLAAHAVAGEQGQAECTRVFDVERNGIVLAVPDILLITGERSVLTRDQVFVYPRRLPGSGIANKSYDMIYFV